MPDPETVKEVPLKTPEEVDQEDVNDRINAFLKAYGELVESQKVDFATYPVFVPDGSGGFKVIIQNTPVDISKQPVKSNFVA